MTITYHSQNRKELVKAISEIIGIPAVYQFMPTCAYKIGECYTVTKSGNLEISDQADREETERLLADPTLPLAPQISARKKLKIFVKSGIFY